MKKPGFAVLLLPVAALNAATGSSFQEAVQPLLEKNCYACHNEKLQSGGLNLKSYTSAEQVSRDREKWELIVHRLENGEMPPKGLPRPDPAQVKVVTAWIQSEFDRADNAMKPESGRVTARRLNRQEYNNTIRDLLAVDTNPAKDFPQDDSGYGFDNIGDVLSLSPVLMEQYLSAAESVVHQALFGPGKVASTVTRHQPPHRFGADGGDNSRFAGQLPFTLTDYDVTGLALPSALHTTHYFPAEGDYDFKIDPEGSRPAPSDQFTVAVWIDGKQAATIPNFADMDNIAKFGSLEGADRTVRVHVPAGEHQVDVSGLNIYDGLPAKYKGNKPNTGPEPPARSFVPMPPGPDATPDQIEAYKRRLANFAANGGGRRGGNRPPGITDITFRVNFVEIIGPYNANEKPSPESRRKVFTCATQDPACARKIVADFARRAYRRPVDPQEVTRLMALVTESRKRGDSFDQSIGTALEAVLVSPQFLFRIEHDPKTATASAASADHAVSDYELASRLSYFLWSSMPDDELLRAAEQKSLRRPEVLKAQVTRMLKDPKANALAADFGGQWLEFRGLESARPDLNRFPRYDDYLRDSERQETEMFFEYIMRQDRSVLEFLNGKYTFLNGKLAEFYGIPGIHGPEFRKVDLTGTPRAGVLTQGSVLTVSSYSTRTSVVLRGKWVLENLLNAPVPPPPPNVPLLDEAKVGTASSLRESMEQHRANPICASCHSRMDPIGFGLENFDAIGQWRTQDGTFPIDASGSLTNGTKFSGPAELTDVLAKQPQAFAGAITEKMLTYALGRGLEPYDRPTLKAIESDLSQNNYRFSSLVLGIVKSLPFQERAAQPKALQAKGVTNVRHP
jgi:hypothetical protein